MAEWLGYLKFEDSVFNDQDFIEFKM